MVCTLDVTESWLLSPSFSKGLRPTSIAHSVAASE